MKNHLLRLAIGVIEPAPKLHPLLGSIYDPAPYRSSEEPFPGEIQTFSPYRQAAYNPEKPETGEISDTESSANSLSETYPKPWVSYLDAAALPGQPSPGSSQALVGNPLPPIAPGSAPEAANPVTSPAHKEIGYQSTASKLQTETQHIDAVGLEPAASLIENNQQQKPIPGHYQPLITFQPPSGPASGPYQPTQPTEAIGKMRADSRSVSAVPQREADEIHIHIGRIEVAAISQPPPRPPAAVSERKSLSLEEYLKRSDGRRR